MKIGFANKKGDFTIGQLIGLVLSVIALFIIIIIIVVKTYGFGDIIGGQQSALKKDSDADRVVDSVDKCPCTYGDLNYDGCPTTFTPEQVKADQQKYNSDTGCGVLEVGTATEQAPAAKGSSGKTAEQKSEAAAFKHYRSVEIFGDDDGSADAQNALLNLVCTSWVGRECPTEDNDCDDDEFNYDNTIKQGCWVMASEDDDTDSNDCGQVLVEDGTIISLTEYRSLDADVANAYQSRDDEADPKNLFSWKWKSKAEYGSLLCDRGFWNGCKEANEGGNYIISNGQVYQCTGSEWVKQQ